MSELEETTELNITSFNSENFHVLDGTRNTIKPEKLLKFNSEETLTITIFSYSSD
jgi:hypothetical protein